MRIIILSLLYVSVSFSQELNGKWVDENYNIFEFYADTLVWSWSSGSRKDYKYEYSKQDSIIKIVTYLSYENNGNWIIQHPINLIKVDFNNENILLKPANKNAINNFFPNKKQIKLVNLESLVPIELNLQEIFFQSSGCLGSCQPVTFYLDKKLNFYFIGGYNLEERKGYFNGRIQLKDKNRLQQILSEGFVQKIPKYLGNTIDAQYFKIILKRDGMIQRIEGTNIPNISWDMISKLIDFHLSIELIKCDEFLLNEDVMENK